jgi:hypothetical protein
LPLFSVAQPPDRKQQLAVAGVPQLNLASKPSIQVEYASVRPVPANLKLWGDAEKLSKMQSTAPFIDMQVFKFKSSFDGSM